jgi:alpha-glucuronidase
MNVKDLQQFLCSLQQPLSTSGAKKAADDLDRACAGLAPFGDLSVAQFADFLAKADSYARTGVVPTTGRAKAPGARSAAKAVDPEAVRAAVEHISSLYERVAGPDVDYTTIDAEVKKLDKQFTKDGVIEIARGFGISGSLKSKKAALEEIQRRMSERKESYERTQF